MLECYVGLGRLCSTVQFDVATAVGHCTRCFLLQSVDASAQRTYALAFGAAHLGIIFPLHRIFERQKQNEVRPAQLSRQCRDNWLVWESGRELHQATQAFLRKAVPIVDRGQAILVSPAAEASSSDGPYVYGCLYAAVGSLTPEYTSSTRECRTARMLTTPLAKRSVGRRYA